MIQEIPYAFLHVIISQWFDIIRENIIGRNILPLPKGFLGSVRLNSEYSHHKCVG